MYLPVFNFFRSFSALFLFLIISSCTPKSTITKTETSQYRMTADISQGDSLTLTEIQPYKKTIDADLSAVIAVSEQPLEKATPEGLLGNLVADACMSKSKEYFSKIENGRVDFCFLNNGGLRNSLPKGDINKKKIFELMPFENELVILELDGVRTKQLFDFMANKGGMPVSGARFVIKNNLASEITVQNAHLDTSRTYFISTSDYLAGGGDDMFFLSGAKSKKYLNLKVRDAIIEYLTDENKKGNKINVSLDGRVSK